MNSSDPSNPDNVEEFLSSEFYTELPDLSNDDDHIFTDWLAEIGKPTATLYALLVIISNVALALTSQTRKDNHLPVTYSKWFDAALYGTGIAYLIYALLFLFRDEKLGEMRQTKKNGMWRIRSLLNSCCPLMCWNTEKAKSSTTVLNNYVGTQNGLVIVSHRRNDQSPAKNAKLRRRRNVASLDSKVGTRGSVYLKLNAIICGVGAMIYACLEFGVWLSNRQCYETISGIIPLLLTIYISAQTYFIFLYSKRIIARHTMLSRFGLMHLVATDVTMWLRVLIDQTLYEFSVFRSQEQINNTQPNSVTGDSDGATSEVNFRRTDGRATSVGDLDLASVASPLCAHAPNLLGDILVDASVFLYPCIIGYAVISAGIVYVMCQNMGSPSTPQSQADNEDDSDDYHGLTRSASNQSCQICQNIQAPGTGEPSSAHSLSGLYSMDCDQAVKGLLAGSVVLAMTIVCLILFFIFKSRNPENAILEAQIGEAILYTLGIGAVTVAFVKTVRNLPKNRHRSVKWELDTAMLLTSMMGVYAFPILSIIGSSDDDSGTPINSALIILTSSMSILQSTIQTVYIFEASNRSLPDSALETSSGKRIPKPGRNSLTFLIVLNLAFWSMNIFKTLRSEASPTQRDFFGFYEWTIITHCTVPLQILYRFHSAASLFEIWKHAYKVKPTQCQCGERNNWMHGSQRPKDINLTFPQVSAGTSEVNGSSMDGRNDRTNRSSDLPNYRGTPNLISIPRATCKTSHYSDRFS